MKKVSLKKKTVKKRLEEITLGKYTNKGGKIAVGMTVMPEVGSRDVHGTSRVYKLCQVSANRVCAINWKSGNRFNNPVEIVEINDLCHCELIRILSNNWRNWTTKVTCSTR